MKFGPHGWAFSGYRILLKLNASSNSEAICVFPIFNNLVSRNWEVLERNIRLNLYVFQFYVVIVTRLLLSSFMWSWCLPSWQAERQRHWASRFFLQDGFELEDKNVFLGFKTLFLSSWRVRFFWGVGVGWGGVYFFRAGHTTILKTNFWLKSNF